MGAKRSEQMKVALKLIFERGYSQAKAAREVGITQGAISQTPEIRARAAAKREANHGTQK